MKLLILYFSGTGNTHYVAHYLARKMELLPIEIQVRSSEQLPAEKVSAFDVLCIGFPVYACDSPVFFREYLDRLPSVKGKGIFIFCTKEAIAGNALRRSLKRLTTKGYVPLGATSVGMPGSDALLFMRKTSRMVRSAENKNYDKLAAADRLARRMEYVLLGLSKGMSGEEYSSGLPLSISGLMFDQLWRFLYAIFGKYIKKKFWVDENCNGCGLCVEVCPAQNIELNNKRATFLDHCYLCMRCIHQCPREAIQIGRVTVDKFRWHGPKGDFNPLKLYASSKK